MYNLVYQKKRHVQPNGDLGLQAEIYKMLKTQVVQRLQGGGTFKKGNHVNCEFKPVLPNLLNSK